MSDWLVLIAAAIAIAIGVYLQWRSSVRVFRNVYSRGSFTMTIGGPNHGRIVESPRHKAWRSAGCPDGYFEFAAPQAGEQKIIAPPSESRTAPTGR